MKKLLPLLAVAMLASCSQVQEGDVSAAVGAGTTISVDLPQTRTSLGSKNENGNYSVYWSAEDKLVANGSPSTKITIKEDGSSAQFEFGLIGGGLPYNLTYPYTEGSLCAEGQPTVVFAAEQNYTEGTFGVGYAPMCGYNEGLGTTVLKHLAGVLRISPYGAVTLSKIEIIAAEGVALAGEFDVDCQTGAITAIEGKTGTKITYTINKALATDASTAEPFFITVPAGELGQCQVILTDSRNLQMTLNWNGKSVVAGVVREFKPFEFKVGASFELGGLTAEDDELVIEEPTEVTPTEPASNEIWYTATAKVTPYKTDVFGANIESNEWDEATGEGVITFDGKVTGIGKEAFRYCYDLTSIIIPNSVTIIGQSAFEDTTSLTYIDIPESVVTIANFAFSGCTGMQHISIPNSVNSMGELVFNNCTGELLINCNVPDQNSDLTNTFNLSKFTKVTIGNSVSRMGLNAFLGCSSLEEVHISDITAWCGIVFVSQAATPLFYAKNLYLNGVLVTNLVIPDNVTEIGSYAFYCCSSLTSITIHETITSIGKNAFYNCSNLAKVYCKPSSPPAIHYYDAYYDEGAFPFNNEMKIYVPREAYDDYMQYTYKGGLSGTTTPANWYNYESYVEPYDF